MIPHPNEPMPAIAKPNAAIFLMEGNPRHPSCIKFGKKGPHSIRLVRLIVANSIRTNIVAIRGPCFVELFDIDPHHCVVIRRVPGPFNQGGMAITYH